MFLALVALAALPDLVPARWPSAAPETLDLVRMTPVNCLLIEQEHWSSAFNDEAAKSGISTFAVIRPIGDPSAAARKAAILHFTGAVLEGSFEAAQSQTLHEVLGAAKLTVIDLGLRSEMKLDGSSPLVGTYQGVWPGIQVEHDGSTKAAPSGAAWIDTNTGFLRFVRASTTATVWIANQPPAGETFPPSRYLQAIGDAAMVGARWVVSLDAEYSRKLLANDKTAVAGWRRMGEVLAFYEAHKDWRTASPLAQLALVEDADSGALLSGGVLDMIATKHTPVRAIPKQHLDAKALAASQMAVNVDPSSLTAAQKDTLAAFTRAGGTLLTGPPGWKFPALAKGQITLEKDDLKKLDDIWRELNSLTGRKNLGARLFNVSSMLSNLLRISSSGQVLVHLVNYSDYPVENVTVHLLGKYATAMVYRPGSAPAPLSGYDVEEGTGYDIDQVSSVATLLIGPQR